MRVVFFLFIRTLIGFIVYLAAKTKNMIERMAIMMVLSASLVFTNAQDNEAVRKIHKFLRDRTAGEISTKCIDLDNDGDYDYVFTYSCGESNCFDVYLTINGKLTSAISEAGNLAYDFANAIEFQPSRLVMDSYYNHCCGESPFDSFRKFRFKNDSVEIVENYVRYDFENYCLDQIGVFSFLPDVFLNQAYSVKASSSVSSVRFSADMEAHNAEFVCEDNTNIIGKLKQNAVVKVLAEKKGKDKDQRTWLYVEIEDSDLITGTCVSPLSYDFKDQKLRGWISDKNVIRQ